MLSEISIPKGTTVIMSLLSANHNKDLWGEDASEWRPERWLGATGVRVQLNGDSGLATDNGETISSATPGVKGGMKYPGVYASMWVFVTSFRCIPISPSHHHQDDLPWWWSSMHVRIFFYFFSSCLIHTGPTVVSSLRRWK